MSRTFVMTGVTSGMGLELARQVAAGQDNRLIAGARNAGAAHELRAAVKPDRLTLLALDVADLGSVRRFAKSVRQELSPKGRIAGLVCNAGVSLTGPARNSPDGHELTFATNHLGHFLLIHEALPILEAGAAVISTASISHNPDDPLARMLGFRGAIFPSARAVASGRLDDGASASQQNMDRYATSKLCNLLTTFELKRRVPPATARFLAFDPGLVPGTSLARDRALPIRLGWTYVLPMLRFATAGVSTMQRSAAALAQLLQGAPAGQRSGAYVDFRLQAAPMWQAASRTDWARDLYEVSSMLCGIPEIGSKPARAST